MTKCNLRNDIKTIIMKLKISSNSTTDNDLATALDTNPNTFSSWKNTTGMIPIENLVDFCNKYNVSLDWLLRGDKISKNFNGEDDLVKIPYFNKLDAYNIINYELEDAAKQNIYVPSSFMCCDMSENKIFALLSQDEQIPITAPKNSTIFINKSDNRVNTYPELFLVNILGQVSIKKVYETLTLKYCIMSENKEVKESIVEKNEVSIIGKIIGVTTWKK